MSRLLSLPPELRLHIWDLLLAPSSDDNGTTLVSRACGLNPTNAFQSGRFYAHDFDDSECNCHKRPFYIHNNKKQLYPVVLRINHQVYAEALPSLYTRRTFSPDPNRRFMTLWDRCAEAWFLFDRFLAGLSSEGRGNIKRIKLPMLLCKYEVDYAREAFYHIANVLPGLLNTEIEVSESSVRERLHVSDGVIPFFHDLQDEDDLYFIGPLMAFAETRLTITAIDKQDLGEAIFERLRPHIEMRVWKQLLPLRMKRERRKIARIRNALGALEYDDVTAGPYLC